MENQDLYKIKKSILASKNLVGLEFSLPMVRNLKLINDELDNFSKLLEESDSLKEFHSKRIPIAKKYAEKDDKNNPIQINNEFILTPENRAKLDLELEPLKKRYKDSLLNYDKKIEQYNKLMKKKCTIKFNLVTEKDIPKEATIEQLEGLVDIIKK